MRRAGESRGSAAILGDQVSFLRAWLEMYQSTGMTECLGRAVEVAITTQRLFGAPGGGCYDTVPAGSFEEKLLPREQPVLDNSLWAESLMVLAELTGDGEYLDWAAATLRILEPAVPGKSYLGSHPSRRMEEDEEALFLPAGSAWGRAQDMLVHGAVRLVVVGDATSAGIATCTGQHCAPMRPTGLCFHWTWNETRSESVNWASLPTGRRPCTPAWETAAWLP